MWPNRIFYRLRGGLGIATVAANAVFAAVTGISIASAAVFTKVAVPEMTRLGYKPRFSVGVVTGSSVSGHADPAQPAADSFRRAYRDLHRRSVQGRDHAGHRAFLGFSIAIMVMALRFPNYVGGATRDQASDITESMSLTTAAGKLIPIAALIALVLGGIYAGWFTPTESGAVGALGALVLTLGKRQLTWRGCGRCSPKPAT